MKTDALITNSLLKTGLLLALLALSAWTLAATAGEPEIDRQVKLKILADDEMVDLDLSHLEVGESEQLYTENGKEIVALRTEEGFEIDVEGRDEPIVVKTGDHAYAFSLDHDCDESDDDCTHDVIVRKNVHVIHEDGEHEHGEGAHTMMFISEDGEHHAVGGHANVWISGDAEGDGEGDGMQVFRFNGGGEGAIEKLLASGALDNLDETKREEILEALRSGHGEGNVRVKVIEKHRHEDDQ